MAKTKYPKPPPPPGGGGGGTSGGSSGGFHLAGTQSHSPFPWMSQYTYNAMARSLQHVASMYGYTVPPGAIQRWIGGGVSVQEVQQRFAALQRVKEYTPYFNQLGQVLANMGLRKPGAFSMKEALAFTTGAAPNEWYNVWAKAATRAGLVTSGVDINGPAGKDMSLTGKQALEVEQHLGRDASAAGGAGVHKVYQAIAAHLQSLPAGRVSGLGFSKEDVITLDTGGRNAAQIASRYAQIIANTKAAASTAPGALGPTQGQPTGYTAGSQ